QTVSARPAKSLLRRVSLGQMLVGLIMTGQVSAQFSAGLSGPVSGLPLGDPGRVKVMRIRDTRTVVGAHGQLLRGGVVSVFKYRRDVLKQQNLYPEGDWTRSPAYWDRMKANGLNAVRLVWFDPWQRSHGDPGSRQPYPHADLDNPNDVAEMLSDFDAIVELASQRNMYVMINYHDTTGFRDPSYRHPANDSRKFAYKQSFDYLKTFWRIVAPRYKDRTHVFYELTNEPVGYHPNDYRDDHLDDFAELYKQVRWRAPQTHLVVLTFTTAPSFGASMLDVTRRLRSRGVYFKNTSVGFHPYDISDLPHFQKPVRDLAKHFPVINTEQNFPASVDDGFDEPDARGYGDELMGTQSMERLSISWFHWNIAGPDEISNLENLILPDAKAKGYSWLDELKLIGRLCTVCQWMGIDQKTGEMIVSAVAGITR
ncbi:MAG: cellulase family glycosylhydrolase, partial [Planctomycetota bacterium]